MVRQRDNHSKERRLTAINHYSHKLEENDRMTAAVQEAIEKARKISNTYHTVFYIAGGLTGMSSEIKERYATLSNMIATYNGMFGYAPHLQGTDPIIHPTITPEEVRDIDYLFSAVVPDYQINCWHPVAHGNAVEAAWGEMRNIPAIYLVPEGITLSRVVRGMTNVAHTITYGDFADSLRQLQALPIFINHQNINHEL